MNHNLIDPRTADNSFQTSEFANFQAQMPARFSHHDPNNLVGSDRYIEILGADVDPTKHMSRTLTITNSFVRQHNALCAINAVLVPISDDESRLLQLAAITHDWGETIVGDVKYDLKTDEDEKQEIQAYGTIIAENSGTDEELDEETEDALVSIIFDPETKLGKIFNTIERVGYLLTALRAHRMITEFSLSGAELEQMNRIRKEVPVRHYDTLQKRSESGLPVAGQVIDTVKTAMAKVSV